jgi:hypothetical protein
VNCQVYALTRRGNNKMTLREKGILMALDKFCKAMLGRGIPARAKVRSYRSDLTVPVSFRKLP